MSGTRLRLLLCAPSDAIEGGIVAVVQGLLEGFRHVPEVDVRRLLYGKFRRHSGPVRRLLRELVQVPVFVAAVLRFRPDAIQIETSFDRKTLVRDSIFLALSRLLRRRVVLHAHGGVFHEIPTWPAWWQAWARRFFGACAAVVVTSTEEHADLCRLLGPSPRFLMVPNPVTVPPLGRPVPRDGDAVRIVFAGRFIPAKGLLDAVAAMRHVRTPGARLAVFGDGEQGEPARQLAEQPGIAGRVAMRGSVGLPDLMAEFRASDIFVFPSYHHEGFPMAFFFAAACGMAIVTTRVRPIPDYCREPDHCLWVAPQDPEALARAIDRLAADPALRARQSASNRALVAQFDPAVIARRFGELYRDLHLLRSA